MKKYFVFLFFTAIVCNTFLFSATEKDNNKLTLEQALYEQPLPIITRNEVIRTLLLTYTTGVTARTLTKKMHPAISIPATIIAACGTLSYSAVSTELGRILAVRKILTKEVLDEISKKINRSSDSSGDNSYHYSLMHLLEGAETTLRPTHWISKELITPIKESLNSL